MFLTAVSRRLGIAIAQPPLIQILSDTKASYICTPTVHLALRALSPVSLSAMPREYRNPQGVVGKTPFQPEQYEGAGPRMCYWRAGCKPYPDSGASAGSSVPDTARAKSVHTTLVEELPAIEIDEWEL